MPSSISLAPAGARFRPGRQNLNPSRQELEFRGRGPQHVSPQAGDLGRVTAVTLESLQIGHHGAQQ